MFAMLLNVCLCIFPILIYVSILEGFLPSRIQVFVILNICSDVHRSKTPDFLVCVLLLKKTSFIF